MTRLPLALPLLLAGCAAQPPIYQPLSAPVYSALGAEPFWLLNIGDNRIVLRTAEGEAIFPRALPRTVGGVRSWQSGEGTQVISIEACPGPCAALNERLYEDRVTVRLSGRELTGCGGRLVRRGRN